MIELYAFMSLLGLGYLLKQTKSLTPKKDVILDPHDIPTVNNMYDSSYTESVKRLEEIAAQKSFQKASQPTKTGVIGNVFREEESYKKKNKVIKSSLAGVEIPQDEFIHNNMVPFFGSRIKQNVDPSANNNVLERFTGEFSPDIHKKKQECKPFFALEKNSQNVFGNQSQTDYYKDRINEPRIRNNERPFEPQYIGPGVGQSYSGKPTGGFQQFETRDYAMPKNIDELRKGSNPKVTYEGRTLPGMGIAQREMSAETNKNRVETFFEQSSDRYLKTTGAYTKDKQRPEMEVKDTNRTDTTREYMGDATGVTNKGQKLESAVKETTRQQFEDFGFRNIDGDYFGQGENDDYGKDTIMCKENERDLTIEKTYEGNLTSLVKSMIAPLEDIFKNTRKEYTIQNPRQYGQLQATFPGKITIKDPNDVARTTIKETTIHDTIESGNLKGATKIAVYDPEDVARTTMRQTTRPMDSQLNIHGGSYKGTLPINDKIQATMKETLIDGERYGNIESQERKHGAYKTTKYDAKTTQKELLSDNDYTGIANKQQGDGYKVAPDEAPDTQKQFLSDKDHYGGAVGENKKPTSYEDIMNATINELREETLEGREPTYESVKVATGVDSIHMDVRKLDIDTFAERQNNNIEHIFGQQTTSPDDVFVTKQRDQLDNDDRLDINILSSLHNNPYALPPLSTNA